jgi:exopolysaccharide production protein ExoZ
MPRDRRPGAADDRRKPALSAAGRAPTLESIQTLRGLAAVSVVVFHAFQWLDDQFWIGAAGVDVFFVISGFVIWTVAARGESAPGAFFWRRLTRVAPAYWLVTLAVAAIALADPAFLPQISLSPRHLLLSLAFIQHKDPRGLAFPVLPPGWSLNYEAIFYLTFAVILFAPARFWLALIVATMAAICVIGLLDPPLYGLAANPMLLQFAAGAWLGRRHVLRRRIEPPAGAIFAVLGLVLFGAIRLAGLHNGVWEFVRPLTWGLPAVMIVAGMVAVEEGALIRWPRLMVRLGDASYAIYLCHMPAVALVAHTLGVHPASLFVPVAAAVSIAAGFVFHKTVETPLIRACRALPTRSRPAAG